MSSAWETPADNVLGPVLENMAPPVVLDACREQLQAGAGDPDWREARVVEALYHPGRYVRVAYALVSDPSVPGRRLWPEADIVYLHAPLREPMSRRGTLLHLNGTQVEAYKFPNDRRLRGLRKFAGSKSSVQAWQAWLDESGSSCVIDPTTLQRLLVRYVPEHKWVVRLRAEVTERGTGVRRKRRTAVRCASSESCSTLMGRHSALARIAREGDYAFRVPEVVGANVEQGILAVEWDRGQSLVETLAERSSVEVLREMAAVVDSFHGAPMADLPSYAPMETTARARAAAIELSMACPDMESRIEAVVEELRGRLHDIGTPPSATLHNDLHWNQVRIKRGVYTVLDLERMVNGDPLIDVANFATQLRMLGHRPEYGVDRETSERWSAEFLDQWVRQTGSSIDPDRFRCHVVWSLLGLAHGMMRHLRAGWCSLVRKCVEEAESAMAATYEKV